MQDDRSDKSFDEAVGAAVTRIMAARHPGTRWVVVDAEEAAEAEREGREVYRLAERHDDSEDAS